MTDDPIEPAEVEEPLPARLDLASDPAAVQQWPLCRRCARQTEPGLPCVARRCPWQRVNGRVVSPTAG